MSPRIAAAALAVIVIVTPRGALAQRHDADSSIARSLLVGALSLPSASDFTPTDSVFSRRVTRGEVQYNRTSTAAMPATLVLGLRSDEITLDSLNWNASVFGLRTGFVRTGAGDDDVRLSALELYFGGRTMGHLEGARANVGAEIVAGWSGMETDTRGSLAFRFPVEFIRGRGARSMAFSIVPAIAWGHMRFRSCEDLGPGDGCNQSGFQLAMGRTRFVLGTGVTLPLGSGLSLTVGAQQLFTRSQQPRFGLALALGR